MTTTSARAPCMRTLRLIGIGIGALILCSCRALAVPLLATVLVAGAHAAETGPREECRTGHCRPTAACGPAAACIPVVPPPPPLARSCPICDGGDHGAPARPEGADRIRNLTAGDTVARYRAADDAEEHHEVLLTASNCTCVFAPKFASVREVVMPSERATPLGVKGLAGDDLVAAEVRLDPVRSRMQSLSLEATRDARPGIGIQERLGPLAVDQAALPDEAEGAERPAARVADDQPLRMERRQNPVQLVGFDVPMAWTCVRAANAIVNGQTPQVVAADRGTATLRFEEPGRAELTLCKRAGSDTARVGEELDFTIFVLNSGDRALDDIVVVDALPGRLDLIPGSPASSLPADVSTDTGDDGAVVVSWRLRDPLPAGGTGFVRFRTIVR